MVYGTLLTLIAVPCIYDAMNREKDMREENLDLDAADERAYNAPAMNSAIAGDVPASFRNGISSETESYENRSLMGRLRDIKENPVEDDPTYDTSLFGDNTEDTIDDFME